MKKKIVAIAVFTILVMIGTLGYLSENQSRLSNRDRLLKVQYEIVAGTYRKECGTYPSNSIFKELFLDPTERSSFVCAGFDKQMSGFPKKNFRDMQKNLQRVESEIYQAEDGKKYFKVNFLKVGGQ
ncbi:MAG: hypothetical protein CME65_08220 [Halobacteriovoraceae bacterium]|nr:hypothetical protein [Halobacteriovoraceae bacterium]|tara:strand:+ start:2439 stop:2816 length:378 start_codon:yes stop_codon:yes gene_type:complete